MSDWGLLIYNASSGTASKYPPAQIAEGLRSRGAEVRVHEFSEGDKPAELATNAIAEGAKWIAVAGGDGTVEAVAKAMVGTDVPLGVIACGTYNNFALNADLPIDPAAAAQIVAEGRTRIIDVGMINGEPFFECVGVGLDAALFPLGEEIKSGAVVKTWDFFKEAAAYPMHRFDVELDQPFGQALITNATNASNRRLEEKFRKIRRKRIKVRAFMITISNGPYYGMNFAVAPDARIDDGKLTVTVFKRLSKFQLWWHYFSIRAGRRQYTPRQLVFRVSRVSITHHSQRHVHADGTPLSEWPVEVTIQPASLKIFSA